MFLPSTYPSLLNSLRNDSAPVPGPPPGPEGVRAPSQPTLGIFDCCCAMAGEQSARSMAPSRIADLRLQSADFRLMSKQSIETRSIVFTPQSKIRNSQSGII